MTTRTGRCIVLLAAAQLGHQSVVLSVSTNPEPNKILAVTKGDGPVPKADARREDWPRRMDLLELKTGMEGVPLEQTVCLSGTPLNALR